MQYKPRNSRLRRDEKVRKRYYELAAVTENGVRLYTDDSILAKMHSEFDIATGTMWKIIKQYGDYRSPDNGVT